MNLEVCFRLLDTLGKGVQMYGAGDAVAGMLLAASCLSSAMGSIAERSQAHA